VENPIGYHILPLKYSIWMSQAEIYMRSVFNGLKTSAISCSGVVLHSILCKQPWIMLQDKTFTTLCSWIMILANKTRIYQPPKKREEEFITILVGCFF
jgi:hypothetical protein